MNITINTHHITPDLFPFEVVERKGLGHPDTLADGLAENAEIAYSNYCINEFGYIPHHNFDKLMIIGGLCKQVYGGGKYQTPIKLIFMGRGSKNFGNNSIPLQEIQINSACSYLKNILPNLDISDKTQIQIQSITSSRSTRNNWFTPKGAEDLPEYVAGPFANDTAAMISYYPLTKCENLALYLERYFYLQQKPRFHEFGQDIKIMVVRKNEEISCTLSVPKITYHTTSEMLYYEREQKLYSDLISYIKRQYANENIKLFLNPQTVPTTRRSYLVTSGSCIDFGEEGAVGRGNKTHGIISTFRPNTMEAPHGKNCVYFAGKILGYLSDVIAKEIYENTLIPCQVILQANIGDLLYEPSEIIISTAGKVNEKLINDIISKNFSQGRKITSKILESCHFMPKI